MKRISKKAIALTMAGALALAACGGDDGGTDAPSTDAPATEAPSTEAPTDSDAPTTEAPAPAGWTVDTSECVDPDAANAPIEGTIKIGSAMPLSGSTAAIAFAPVKDGYEAYIDWANEQGILDGVTIEVQIEDDQYNKDLTPGAVEKLLDSGVSLFSGIIGTPNNAAVRDILNEECYPQLFSLTGSKNFGQPEDYPWTTGILIEYSVESRAYAKAISDKFGGSANVALFTVNNEFGQEYVEAFEAVAPDFGISIVAEETQEATDGTPPVSQLNSIASKAPDAIVAVPLGAACAAFLTEVANAKAANPGWSPEIYLTATCSSSLILSLAGANATGLYTSSNLVDVLDPESAALPAVAEYIAYMESLGKGDIITTANAGWHTAEMTVKIIKQAMESPDGLTRASIINAARNFDQTGSLARPGVRLKSVGIEDPFYSESLQIMQYDAETKLFTDIGELITDFEG
ncbi:MAG: ABC transporter substrate-binding protein [Actinomycetota bacterium]|nr:ABC transporter substrate-binding protein [Actinomycetota bacterium]MDA2972087.1 ABC transporter substrate-binding protein [Actinomycetota bacterium]MDA3001623.1 ABC transporter substrate-binding protein [Actinomycetota bacterium]